MAALDIHSSLTGQRLRELLHYDPETGVFTRRKPRGKTPAGAQVGWVCTDGYCSLYLDGMVYRSHRLAWFYMTGKWPSETIDHRDLNKTNNRWANLREATQSQQGANKAGAGGLPKGVTTHNTGRYQAQIVCSGRSHYLGLFDSPFEAHHAYVAAAKRLFGEFARAA